MHSNLQTTGVTSSAVQTDNVNHEEQQEALEHPSKDAAASSTQTNEYSFLFNIYPQPLEKHFSSCQNTLTHTHTYSHTVYKNKLGRLNLLLCRTYASVSVCTTASICIWTVGMYMSSWEDYLVLQERQETLAPMKTAKSFDIYFWNININSLICNRH